MKQLTKKQKVKIFKEAIKKIEYGLYIYSCLAVGDIIYFHYAMQNIFIDVNVSTIITLHFTEYAKYLQSVLGNNWWYIGFTNKEERLFHMHKFLKEYEATI